MASAAALAYLPASGDDSWPWALLGLTPIQALELLLPCLFICWLFCEALFYIVMLLVHRRLDVLTLPERYVWVGESHGFISSYHSMHQVYRATWSQFLHCLSFFLLSFVSLITFLPSTPSRSKHDPEEYVHKVMDIVDSVRGVYPFETFLTRWCGSATLGELKRGNIAQFLAWALLSESVESLLPKDFTMIMRMVDMVDTRFELHLEHGLNTDVRTLRMTLEPLEVIHRPLCVYLCVTYVPRFFGNCVLRLQGFERLNYEGTVYWYRPSQDWPKTARQLPLIFFHGVSPGQCAYAGLTTLLSEGRSAVLVEIPHIAMSLEAFQAKSEKEVTTAVKAICSKHQIQHFMVAGHSYGTIWAGWVLRAMREEVKQAVLLDPVCILLCLPNTPFNFLYRLPHDPPSHLPKAPSIFTAAGIKKRVLDYGLHYVVSRELTIANAMRRQFWWHKKILHAEEIHCPIVVGLASDDILLSAPAIRKYLQDNCTDLEIIWWQDFSHGEILTSLPCQHNLDQTIRAQEEKYYHGRLTRPIWEYPDDEVPPSNHLEAKRSKSRMRLLQESSTGGGDINSNTPSRRSPSKLVTPLSPASSSSASSCSTSDSNCQRRKQRWPQACEDTSDCNFTYSCSRATTPTTPTEPRLASLRTGAGRLENLPSAEQRRRWQKQQDREREQAAAEAEEEARCHPVAPLCFASIPESESTGLKRSTKDNIGSGVKPALPLEVPPASLLSTIISAFK